MKKRSIANVKPLTESEVLFQIREVEIVYQSKKLTSMPQVKTSNDIYLILKEVFDKRKLDYKEEFYVVLLNRANFVLGVSRIGVGSTSGVSVNLKEVFQLVLKANASTVILSHNHPSGNLIPSDADLNLTQRIKKGCELLDIQLLDHLIVTSESYYSIADEGLL